MLYIFNCLQTHMEIVSNFLSYLYKSTCLIRINQCCWVHCPMVQPTICLSSLNELVKKLARSQQSKLNLLDKLSSEKNWSHLYVQKSRQVGLHLLWLGVAIRVHGLGFVSCQIISTLLYGLTQPDLFSKYVKNSQP